MTVVHDRATQSTVFTTVTPFTFTHTPLNTPRGVLVLIAQGDVDTDTVTGVTYGGVAMSRILTAADTVGEPRRSYVYALGSTINTGAQSVSITHGGLSAVKWAVVVTVTAAGDTEIGASGILEGDQADPQIVLDSGSKAALRYCVNSSGGGGIGWTQLPGMASLVGKDFGDHSGRVDRQSVASAGIFTIGYTVGSEDVAMVAVAVQEIALPPPPPPPPPTGGGGSSVLLVVSADAPTELHEGNIVCDGVSDQVQINAAILAATQLAARGGPAGGLQRGTVQLTGGRFNISGPILIRTGVTLQGSGFLTEVRAVNVTSTGMFMIFDIGTHMTLVRDMWVNGNYASGGTTAAAFHYVGDADAFGTFVSDPFSGNDPQQRISNLAISGFSNNAARHGIKAEASLGGCIIDNIYLRDIGGHGIWFLNSPDSLIHSIVAGGIGLNGAYMQGAFDSLADSKFFYCDGYGVEATGTSVKLSNIEVQDSASGFRLAGASLLASGLLANTAETTGIDIAANGVQLNGFQVTQRTGGGARYPTTAVGLQFTGTPTNCTVVGRVDTTDITTRIAGTTSGAGNFIRVTGNSALLSVG